VVQDDAAFRREGGHDHQGYGHWRLDE
jgi:hypothetical protein